MPARSTYPGMAVTLNILEKPIERIRETCEMIGAGDKFDRALLLLGIFTRPVTTRLFVHSYSVGMPRWPGWRATAVCAGLAPS